MTPTWTDDNELAPERLGFLGWFLVVIRCVPLVGVVVVGLLIHGIIRLIERPFFGQSRPISPIITQWVCRLGLLIIGLKLRIHGDVMNKPGAVVANHSSWLDIFVLNARKRIYFVAKSEIKGWAGIGWLARATGTVFIRRDRRDARQQTEVFKTRLSFGHRLLFFPEGTSTDNQQVCPFKTTLFAPFLSEGIREDAHIQAVSVIYHAPKGRDPRFYGFWGNMVFGSHFLQVLGATSIGSVDVICSPAVSMMDYTNRKKLAADLEKSVRQGFEQFSVLDR
jgi:lyso-ornithine lipid O-acyltransferase